MAEFRLSIPIVLKHEGGFVNNPNDPGGATVYGISLRWLESQGIDIDGDGDVDIDDILALKRQPALAEDLYYKHFWQPPGYSYILDQTLATKVFDMAVNMGHARAHRLVQQAILRLRPNGLLVTGNFGTITLQFCNTLDPYKLVEVICQEQANFYLDLIRRKPKLAEFKNGWLKRAAWKGA